MSVNTELAAAARRVAALNCRLPEIHRVDIAGDWADLLDRIEGRPDWQARRSIDEWVEIMEIRLSGILLHAPLDLGDDQ
jgi:hypothetical protein